ncbi:hypothetical protein VNO78_16171 [Psophocarpus tetragonolobus]|uniref:Uncharacterized protein n=1 Tax=Psophocarpus tetragonolobus TaxID=3891 RepID=A0AAN9XJV1_PSOTE
MKREGRQHGMVRSFRILPNSLNLKPETRFITRFDSPPTAGLFVKVSSKPNNHSKFTGKCGTPKCLGCHLHPTCKSKDKTKGTQKRKNRRVIIDKDQPNSNYFGLSASVTLDNLFYDFIEDEDSDQVDCQLEEENKCILEMGQKDQVEEEKEEKDWLLV